MAKVDPSGYATAQVHVRDCALVFGKDRAGINLYLVHQFKLNSDLKAIVEMSRPNISLELFAKLVNYQTTLRTVEGSFLHASQTVSKISLFFPEEMFANNWHYM